MERERERLVGEGEKGKKKSEKIKKGKGYW